MSDSAHQGDAARLEAALERIVQALGNAATPHALPPGASPPHRDADAPAAAGIDVAQLGARLDGLITELRDMLGEPGDAAAQS